MDFIQVHSHLGLTKSDAEMDLGEVFAGNLLIAWILSSLYGKWLVANTHQSPESNLAAGLGFLWEPAWDWRKWEPAISWICRVILWKPFWYWFTTP